MTCPVCKSRSARRSRRHNIADYVFGVVGVYPWRCRGCETRFHARAMPLGDAIHAHCPICGNLELKRISAEYVPGHFTFLWRLLSIPAYRCEPCRHKYFSIRPYRSRDREYIEMTSSD